MLPAIQIGKQLQAVAGDRGIPYLKFVVNPDSFSQVSLAPRTISTQQ